MTVPHGLTQELPRPVYPSARLRESRTEDGVYWGQEMGQNLQRISVTANPSFTADLDRTEDLTLGFRGGRSWSGAAWVLIPDGTLALTDNATNYVQRGAAVAPTVNVVGFSAAAIPMCVVITENGQVIDILDQRPTGDVVTAGGPPPPPGAHHLTHEAGGTDQVSVTGLLGLLNDPQHPLAHTHPWSDITGTPATFPPAAHVHPASDITPGTFGGPGTYTFPGALNVNGPLTVTTTTMPQLVLAYDATQRLLMQMDSTGQALFTATGTFPGLQVRPTFSVLGTASQLFLLYDFNAYMTVTVAAGGDVSYATAGAAPDPSHIFGKHVLTRGTGIFRIENTGSSRPTAGTGKGIELQMSGGNAFMSAWDATAAALFNLRLSGLTVTLTTPGNVSTLTASAGLVAIIGQATISGELGIKGLTYTWPAAQALGVLKNAGAGTLSWSPVSYSELSGTPATFPPAAHTHPAGDITPGTFSGGSAGTYAFAGPITKSGVLLDARSDGSVVFALNNPGDSYYISLRTQGAPSVNNLEFGLGTTTTNWLRTNVIFSNTGLVTAMGGVATPSSTIGFYAGYAGLGDASYRASLFWNALQLGNNGPNYIVGGRTVTGGDLQFWVNNTNDVAGGGGPNGALVLRLTTGANLCYVPLWITAVAAGSAATLQLLGNAISSGTGFYLQNDVDNTTYVVNVQAKPIHFYTGNAIRMTLAAGPGDLLLYATAGNTAQVELRGNGTGASGGFVLQHDGGNNAYLWNYAAGPMYFGTSGVLRLTIGAAGGIQSAGYFSIVSGAGLYLDGASDTYLVEQSANVVGVATGGVFTLQVSTTALKHITTNATAVFQLTNNGATMNMQAESAATLRITPAQGFGSAADLLLINAGGSPFLVVRPSGTSNADLGHASFRWRNVYGTAAVMTSYDVMDASGLVLQARLEAPGPGQLTLFDGLTTRRVLAVQPQPLPADAANPAQAVALVNALKARLLAAGAFV